LDVADDARVAIIELLAEAERRLDAGLGIAVPARRMAELEVLQREDVQAPREEALGRRDIRRRVDARIGVDPRRGEARKVRGRHDAAYEAPALRLHRRGAHDAMADLGRRHATQPIQLPGEARAQAYCRCQISRLRSAHSSFSWFCRPSMWS